MGLQHKKEDSEKYFFYGCHGDKCENLRYPSNETTGMASSLELYAGYLITDNLMINTGFTLRNATDYDDYSAMFAITFFFDRRKGLIQDDLKKRWLDSLF